MESDYGKSTMAVNLTNHPIADVNLPMSLLQIANPGESWI